MSFADVLAGPECGVDIYEETNEETWVNCAVKIGWIQTGFLIPVAIIIVLLIMHFWPDYKTIAGVVCVILVAGILLHQIYWTPLAARNEFLRTQKELKSRMSAGMSHSSAIKELQKERLAREAIAATRSAADTNMAGMSMIARAMRK